MHVSGGGNGLSHFIGMAHGQISVQVESASRHDVTFLQRQLVNSFERFNCLRLEGTQQRNNRNYFRD